MKEKYIPLSYDLPFKLLFGTSDNIRFTIDMLENLFNLPKGSLNGSTIENSVVLDRNTVEDKKFEVDILLKSPNGELYVIEIQRVYDKNAEIKNTMYISKLYGGELLSGEKYSKVKPVTLINFVKTLKVHKGGNIIKRYCMTNIEDSEDKILEDLFTIIIVDIDSECEITYNKSVDGFESWRRLIGADTYEEVQKIINITENPLIKEAMKEVENFMDKDFMQSYAAHEKLLRDQLEDAKIEAKEEGKIEGILEGILEGKLEEKIEIAKNMISSNLSIEIIQKCTGLKISEIKSLLNEIK